MHLVPDIAHTHRANACLQCPLTNRADILMTAVTSIHPLKFLDSQTFTPIECSTMCKTHSECSLHDSPSPTLARFKLPELSNSSTGSGLTLQLQTDSSNIITRRAEVYVPLFWNRSIAFLFLPNSRTLFLQFICVVAHLYFPQQLNFQEPDGGILVQRLPRFSLHPDG